MNKLLISLLLISNLFSFESYDYVNKKYKFTSVTELKANYFPLISPYYYAQKLQYFKAFDGVNIAYKIFSVKNAKANIVISSGRTEGMVKYQELIYDLNQNGYGVYILDHRGQGNSGRMLEDSQIGYVAHFEDYVRDMHQFVSSFVKKDTKLILLGHSMGGTIASLYAEKYPNDFNALVLSAPMHQPDLGFSAISGLICSLIEKRHHDIKRYIIGEISYDAKDMKFENNKLTHSKIRYEIMKIAYDIEPVTKIGGPSVKWVAEACSGSAKSVRNAGKIKIPTLLLHPENDEIVTLKPQEEFCKRAQPYCTAYKIDGAYHELFVEKDTIREKSLSAILDFISKI